MHVSKDTLLMELPPYRDEWVMRKKNQKVKDIIRFTIDAYPRFESDYDRIGLFFKGTTVAETCDNLYHFCKQNLQYVEETVEWQSIPRPAGLLIRGFCDCKGYAGFIGGCLGAMNRMGAANIDWVFCFASYDIKQRTPYHVFIIVYTEDGEIWIDPTPGANDMMPEYFVFERINESSMPLMENIGSLMENVGRVSNRMGTTGDPAADAALNVSAMVSKIISDSNLRGTYFGNWLSDFAKPGQALTDLQHLLFGYKYTGGDYALGEIFIDRVLNKPTYNRWDTPDGLVPIAWNYFTQLFGLPIAVNTDLDTLRDHGDLESYLNGRPEQRGYVTQDQVTRAHAMLNMPAFTAAGSYANKYGQWPPSMFGLVSYVAPIPDARIPGQAYTGTLPNGQQIVNGYPVSAAAVGPGVSVNNGSTPAASTSFLGSMTMPVLIAAGALLWWWYDSDNE